jgi:hypothetical protein
MHNERFTINYGGRRIMKSVMQHRFSNVPDVKIPRSRFNRSHGVKTTFDAGYLIPFFIDEALPGDTFNTNVNGFARLSTPTYPLMDNMFMETFFFAVPMRLVWDNWKKFCGEQIDPGDSIAYTIPVMDDDGNAQNFDNETIWDYFGLPTKVTDYYAFSALPFRAYNLIWNEWFRDQNLQDSVEVPKDDGPDDQADYSLLRRGKRHDYFTSCLPWLQKGTAVSLSLGTTAPVDPDGTTPPEFTNATDTRALRSASGQQYAYFGSSAATASGNLYWDTPALVTDLASATASTVNELRQAVQVQRILERDARAGTRYTEIVESHFGVTSPDSRMQRPEYLGGGSTPVVVKQVPRTDSSPGEVGAFGVAGFNNHGFSKSFTEHCIIIGLVNVRADLTYQEGLDRMWSRSTRYDFYWPALAHLGEQAVLNQEIYIDAAMISAGTEDDVFGYQERFAEYRYKPSKITGKFRSNDAASLDAWHLGIEFGSLPTLDATFIVDNPPVDRVIATPTEPHFIFDSYIQMDCTRPMPVYSIPGHIDHF